MISPWLDPSRKPPNALRGLRRKMAYFIPNAGVHTKGSYNSTTTRFWASLKKKCRWALGRLVAEPRGGRFSGVRVTAALELLRLAATIGGTALRRNPLRSTSKPEVPMFRPDSGSCKVRSVEIRSDLASPLRNALMKRGWRAGEVADFTTKGYDASPHWFAPHPVRD